MKHTATIVMTDDGTDRVGVKITFDPEGAKEESAAHRTAVDLFAKLAERLSEAPRA